MQDTQGADGISFTVRPGRRFVDRPPPGSLRRLSAAAFPAFSPLLHLAGCLPELRTCPGEVCQHGECIPDLPHLPWRHDCAPQDDGAHTSCPALERSPRQGAARGSLRAGCSGTGIRRGSRKATGRRLARRGRELAKAGATQAAAVATVEDTCYPTSRDTNNRHVIHSK